MPDVVFNVHIKEFTTNFSKIN